MKNGMTTRFYSRSGICYISAAIWLSTVNVTSADQLEVPFQLGRGWSTYESQCVECHGAQGGGTNQGPPLVHEYYVPSHHSDAAIVRAILQGSKQHHWNYGDMPAVDGISQVEAEQVTAFVRWLQKEKDLLPK